jgi:hypothetical protein
MIFPSTTMIYVKLSLESLKDVMSRAGIKRAIDFGFWMMLFIAPRHTSFECVGKPNSAPVIRRIVLEQNTL